MGHISLAWGGGGLQLHGPVWCAGEQNVWETKITCCFTFSPAAPRMSEQKLTQSIRTLLVSPVMLVEPAYIVDQGKGGSQLQHSGVGRHSSVVQSARWNTIHPSWREGGGGEVAEPKFWNLFAQISALQCTLCIDGVTGAKNGTVEREVTVLHPTTLQHYSCLYKAQRR